ncbi:DUF4350 domain-containing protein [Thermodesulfobacteriota bacterium]
MFRNSRSVTLIFLMMLALFVIGSVRLFVLRFEAGDIYPEYSSLRSDPLGTKILFESMKGIAPLNVDRNYRPIFGLSAGHDTTLFSLGMQAHTLRAVPRDTFNAMSGFLTSGGRMVISFFPERSYSHKKDGGETGKNGKKEKDETERNKGKEKEEKEMGHALSLAKRWGVEFGNAGAGHDAPMAVLTSDDGEGPLPDSISCHTALTFDVNHPAWKVIYRRGKHPVLIERQMGKGSIVMLADSYLFSNEAMLKNRYPELLIWFMGKNRHMLFDESHLGIKKSVGVVRLARKYNLHHFFAILLFLAVLYIWMNAVHLVPPSDKDAGGERERIRTERDHMEGLLSLLRRNIPKKDILRTCCDEWERGLPSSKERLKGKIEEIKKVVEGDSQHVSKEDPVKGYRAICKILSERNRS